MTEKEYKELEEKIAHARARVIMESRWVTISNKALQEKKKAFKRNLQDLAKAQEELDRLKKERDGTDED